MFGVASFLPSPVRKSDKTEQSVPEVEIANKLLFLLHWLAWSDQRVKPEILLYISGSVVAVVLSVSR